MRTFWIVLLLPAFFASSHGYCGAPPRLNFGELDTQFIDQNNFSTNANVTYNCQPGFIRASGTKNVITCLSNSTWSTPETFCTRRSCGDPGEIQNGDRSIENTLFGSRVNYTCHIGYNMISKRNYRDCLADGTWSNEVPICDVQTCPPPDAIADGKFNPDNEEYEYLNAVIYECNDKTSSLFGEKSIFCTAYGNWSSDPPKCSAVNCEAPVVLNAIKLSGFTGPYILNSAVRFQCNQGYTMEGEASVKCNANKMWEPPLPTCKSTVTQRPTTTKEKEGETGVLGSTVSKKPSTTKEKDESNGGTTVTQKPSATKEKDESNGGTTVTQKPSATKEKDESNGEGNNTGAIVGGVIAGIFGILFAASAIIYVCWFKKKRGGVYVAPTPKNLNSGTSGNTIIIFTMSVMALVINNVFFQ